MLERTPYRLSRAYVIPIVFVAIAVLIGAGIRLFRTVPPPQAVELSAPAPSAPDATRVSEGGDVTITATWQGAEGLVFTIVMDTHAVDLDGYDLAQLAALRVDGGPELAPLRWEAPAGGHHREGTLVFPDEQGGKPVIDAQTRTIQLTVRDVAGVPERVLTWER